MFSQACVCSGGGYVSSDDHQVSPARGGYDQDEGVGIPGPMVYPSPTGTDT